MLGVILGNYAMLLTFQIVLVLLGLTVVARIVKSLRGHVEVGELATFVTRIVLKDIFPLILLSMLVVVDPTHFIVLIFYYLTALLIAIRALLELSKLLGR